MFEYESVVAPQGIPLQAQVAELRRREVAREAEPVWCVR